MTAAAVAARLGEAWGELEALGEPTPGVRLVRGSPRGARGWFSVATCGLSAWPLPLPDELVGLTAPRCELVTYAGDDEPWPAEALGEIALGLVAGKVELWTYQAIALSGPLGAGTSELVGMLILPPYFEAEPTAALGDDGTALLWAAPMTLDELQLAWMAGGRVIEELFFEADLRPVPDLGRASFV